MTALLAEWGTYALAALFVGLPLSELLRSVLTKDGRDWWRNRHRWGGKTG